MLQETRFFLKQAGLGPLWGPGCSHPPSSQPHLLHQSGGLSRHLLFLLQVSTLKGQLEQEFRRSSASFSPRSGPAGE